MSNKAARRVAQLRKTIVAELTAALGRAPDREEITAWILQQDSDHPARVILDASPVVAGPRTTTI
jgi:hypothetical protein